MPDALASHLQYSRRHLMLLSHNSSTNHTPATTKLSRLGVLLRPFRSNPRWGVRQSPWHITNRASHRCVCRAAEGSSTPAAGGGDGQPPSSHSKPQAEGDSEGGSGTGTPTWPRWYKVWIWATALAYLVWRYKWRRDRRLAAEQFAQEQQQEQELKQQWLSFAQSYGVKHPVEDSS